MFKEKRFGCQASKENVVLDRSEWRGFVRGSACMGHSLGNEPQTLRRCHTYMKPVGIKYKGENLFLFFKLCFSFTIAHFTA